MATITNTFIQDSWLWKEYSEQNQIERQKKLIESLEDQLKKKDQELLITKRVYKEVIDLMLEDN